MSSVIIVGKGPAGISAALYTIRAGIETTVIASGGGSLLKAEKIENYFGFARPISGRELMEAGEAQAKSLGVKFVEGEVVGISYDDGLAVSTETESYTAQAVILATGAQRAAPKKLNLERFEGAGVNWCAVCDGFFYRGKDVAVLGAGKYALHEASVLLPITRSVTLLTDGKEPEAELPEKLLIDRRPVKALEGEGRLESVVMGDGGKVSVSGLFIALGVAGSADLAKKLGAMTNGDKIAVNPDMTTNIPGLFAAGDCTGGLLQVAKAVSDGAAAGTSAIKYLRNAAKA